MNRRPVIDDLCDSLRTTGPLTVLELADHTGRDPRLVREAIARTDRIERVGTRAWRATWAEVSRA